MTVQTCPACAGSKSRTLEASKIAGVNYVACEHCHHIWSASKETGELVKNVTPLPEPSVPEYTGLMCMSCLEPVAVIDVVEVRRLTMHCPGCGHRWSYEQPNRPKQ